jgi:catalase
MTPEQQQVLFENTARAINGASQQTVERHIANCTQADPAYGEGVRKAIEALDAQSAEAVKGTVDDNAPV